MSNCDLIWREGVLFEISPFGTGFIADGSSGRAFGFHVSMITPKHGSNDMTELEGRSVRFIVDEGGAIATIETQDTPSVPVIKG